jgi:HSP20 family protein
MFKKLIPWKKRHDPTADRDELTRQAGEDDPLTRMRQEVDSALSRFFADRWLHSRFPSMWDEWPTGWNRDLGWEDQGDRYVFRAELPGFEPDDFDVKISGNTMTVHAEHKQESKHGKDGNGYRYVSYTRTCTLPSGADESKIEASYHSGVLELGMAKKEDAQTKRIEVKSV